MKQETGGAVYTPPPTSLATVVSKLSIVSSSRFSFRWLFCFFCFFMVFSSQELDDSVVRFGWARLNRRAPYRLLRARAARSITGDRRPLRVGNVWCCLYLYRCERRPKSLKIREKSSRRIPI